MRKAPLMPLPAAFFKQDTLELARALLGCLLVKETEEGTAAGFIVETEAYMGASDRGSAQLWKPADEKNGNHVPYSGHVYTYQMHTHCLVNVVSGREGTPEAILIRALEPFMGTELMFARRKVKEAKQLTNGPGKLAKALGITMEDYGRVFYERPLFIAEGYEPEQIETGAHRDRQHR